MTMGYYYNWNDLPEGVIVEIAYRSSSLEDYFIFTAVCKSWNSATQAAEKPWWLPTRNRPMLLLAEEVAPGAIPFKAVYHLNEDFTDTDEEEEEEREEEREDDDDDNDDNEDDDRLDEDEHTKYLRWKAARYDYLKNSIGSSRGLYSLSSRKTYNIELPEAAGRLILGTNRGWLVTLGRDLQINLLHPLLRHQFSLPSMLTFPRQSEYHEDYTPEEDSEIFIQKVAMSSRLLNKNTNVRSFHHHSTPSPIIMAVYRELGFLAFARLGDKVWTDVNVPSKCFHDIVYHKGNFYAVDENGNVYVCCIDDNKKRGPRGTKIASLNQTDYWDQYYLVESLSGSDLFILVRHIKTKFVGQGPSKDVKYRTTDFAIWKLDLKYYDSIEIPSCTLTEVNNLGNEAIFVGRASSLSVSSSEIIKPNSIYFTDDNWEHYFHRGGGHDMGIFDVERRTIEPHFQGKSIHLISPPLWYI